MNRGRHEQRQLRLQDTTPEQVCFVAARQIGQLRSRTSKKKADSTDRTWPLITSADPGQWPAIELLRCRRRYWGIEAGHQRLDTTLDEDRSRTRTTRAMTVLGMFRRLATSLACVWLDDPTRRKRKMSTRDFLSQLRAQHARRAFALVSSVNPKAWNAK
jgi:hypothetical protein